MVCARCLFINGYFFFIILHSICQSHSYIQELFPLLSSVFLKSVLSVHRRCLSDLQTEVEIQLSDRLRESGLSAADWATVVGAAFVTKKDGRLFRDCLEAFLVNHQTYLGGPEMSRLIASAPEAFAIIMSNFSKCSQIDMRKVEQMAGQQTFDLCDAFSQ